MQETKAFRKNKIQLTDYDYQRDIRNRMVLSQLSEQDFAILEEILYSPLQTSLTKLAKNLDLSIEELKPLLTNLTPLKLFTIQEDLVIIDKEQRKYIEAQIEKFDEDFIPGMEFLQDILKGVPIHTLPIWYHIPRSSNNIFESIIEKYLMTPQIFQRYLIEFASGDPLYVTIIEALEKSPTHTLPAHLLRDQLGLPKEEFEELVLYLEFNFICCLTYEKTADGWHEVISFFQEWKDYLFFLKQSTPKPLPEDASISLLRTDQYAFIEDMSTLLGLLRTTKIELATASPSTRKYEPTKESAERIAKALPEFTYDIHYITRLIQKLLILGLVTAPGNILTPTEPSSEWLQTPIDKRAHITFKHPHNHLSIPKIPSIIASERNLVEIQKSLSRIATGNWYTFESFIKNATILLGEDSKVSLKKCGKQWRYTIPEYTAHEQAFIRAVIFDWLFESGIVQVGVCLQDQKETPCLRLTTLGHSFLA